MIYINISIWSEFEIKNWIEDQSSPKFWTVLGCIFVPNLEIATSIGGELWHGQAQDGLNFDFKAKFNLEGQGQSPPPPKKKKKQQKKQTTKPQKQ